MLAKDGELLTGPWFLRLNKKFRAAKKPAFRRKPAFYGCSPRLYSLIEKVTFASGLLPSIPRYLAASSSDCRLPFTVIPDLLRLN